MFLAPAHALESLSLEMEDGGFETTDEVPAFGDAALDVDFPAEEALEDSMGADFSDVRIHDADAVWVGLEGDAASLVASADGQLWLGRGHCAGPRCDLVVRSQSGQFVDLTLWLDERGEPQGIEEDDGGLDPDAELMTPGEWLARELQLDFIDEETGYTVDPDDWLDGDLRGTISTADGPRYQSTWVFRPEIKQEGGN
jgi:hypothetical protein